MHKDFIRQVKCNLHFESEVQEVHKLATAAVCKLAASSFREVLVLFYQGVEFAVFVHESRALTEGKEHDARALVLTCDSKIQPVGSDVNRR